VFGGQPIQPYYEMPVAQPQRARILPQRREPASSAKTDQKPAAGAAAQIRMQSDEAAQGAPPLRMPSPEQLGVGPKTRQAEVNWTTVRTRMESLSVSSFHLQKLEGGFRFTCVVPVAGERRKIEADGLTEAEAIDLALTRAESRRAN
jgi:hypothetical protein